jgi:KDO2-lipid IV(A) lauroyltransferase
VDLAGALVSGGYAGAWAALRHAPERPAYAVTGPLADLIVRRRGPGVRRLAANLSRVVEPGEPLATAVRLGVRSYVRYWVDVFRLPTWSPDRIVRTCRTQGHEPMADALAAGRGVVCAVAHMGNWDHGGAWAAVALGPVTSVAERLRPESLFRRFVEYRRSIGIDVLPLTGDGSPVPELLRRLRGGGFVALVADRDLTGRGVIVDLLGERVRAASGPAALAARTGAALHPATVHYEARPDSPSGWGVVVRFGPEVPVPDRSPDTVRTATQACADAWSAGIRARPEDWHMLQPIFVADLPADGGIR